MSVVKRLGRARAGVELGVVADHYHGDRKAVLRLLNDALATKIVCMLRYRRHHFMARGLAAQRIAEEFLVHADEELAHADLIAERMVQLGGEPDFAPETLQPRSHAQYVAASSIIEMVRENLVAERIAVETYLEIARWLGTDDPTTRRVIENILQKEEEHAEDMSTLLGRLPSE